MLGRKDERYFFNKSGYFIGLTLFIQELIKSFSKLKIKKDIEIHFESQLSFSKRPKYLILLEHKFIHPQNFFIFPKRYKKIYGWDLRFRNLPNFFYVKYPNNWDTYRGGRKRKLKYSMICTNRNIFFGPANRSLYNERQKVINYCEENPHIDFHLYGVGWDLKDIKPGIFSRIKYEMQKRGFISLKREKLLKNYRGIIDDKNEILKASKFNFCFENTTSFSGYVSEKIWDSIASLAIPVYWPSWEIPEDYLPSDCYINASKFANTKELFDYLENISEEELEERRKKLYKLAKSKKKEISIESYTDLILKDIQKDINS